MTRLLYLIAVILIIAWSIGFFAYSAGGLIHILLIVAFVAIVLAIIRGNDDGDGFYNTNNEW
ncbi:MAG TPA: lmo0937 family membrane protein [Saprospiraceae bacterium]|nr:lmo0937 family membrane protein [Saprospiraceae bacterium]